MEENLIVRLEVVVDFVHSLDDSLGRGAQANAERIVPPKLQVRQLENFLHRWEMLAVRAVTCTSIRPSYIRDLNGRMYGLKAIRSSQLESFAPLAATHSFRCYV